MSDRPNNPPEKPRVTGGWHRPSERGAWQPPERREDERDGGWRVPTLPPNLRVEPQAEGVWHLPRPEDTSFTPEDVIEITPERVEEIPARPEDMLFEAADGSQAAPVLEALAPEDIEPEGETSDTSIQELLAAEEPPVEDTDSLLALEGLSAIGDDTASLLALEESAQQAAVLDEIEEEEDGAFSMSELLALSSLVEQAPAPSIVPTVTEETGDTAVEGTQQLSPTGAMAAADDPAAYARRQLELLSGTGAQPAVADAASDPAEYARRQLEQLGGQQPAAAVQSPEQQTMAGRFRETEDRVRALRASYQSGQLSRDDLQAQLRQLMILDENRVWWMMGVETDTWYKFDNNQWVVATPPYGTNTTGQFVSQSPGASPTMTSGLPTVQEGFGSSVGYNQFGDTFGTPIPTGGFEATEEMPLPRPVPERDPDLTVVSPGGAYLNPVQDYAAETVQGVGRVDATIVNPAIGIDDYGIPAPGPTDSQGIDSAPDYNLEQDAPTYEEIAERERARTAANIVRLVLVAGAAVLLLVACGLGYFLVTYNNIASQWQPQIDALANYQPDFQTVRVMDMNNNQIAELNSSSGGARTDVPLSRISPFMIHAVVSLENERFYVDPGWDWVAIGRAFFQNLSAGQVESGASTITQQIAEQLVLRQATTTPDLKFQEIIIAAEIAKQYTKEEILELYLNEIFFGNQSYGVEAASQFYFGHSANDLNLPESALLAGMIAAPARFNPVRVGGEDLLTYNNRREATFDRMDFVIQRMLEVGCLPIPGQPPAGFCVDANVVRQAAAEKATVEATRYQLREVNFRYPHFVYFVRNQVIQTFGEDVMFRRGFVIKTTLNPTIQDAAERALRNQVTSLAATGINTGSVMVTDPRTGAIRAMVGSPDFNNEDIDGQVNGALTWQQPGSSIKPIVYTGAIEGLDRNGDGILDYMTPASILWDVPTTFQPNYRPVNFDGGFVGPIALRYALQQSRNVPAVKAYEFIGADKFRDISTRMGLTFLENAQFGLATGLGATEVKLYDMMAAYGTLANNGVRAPLFAIDSITDQNGQPILLPERTPPTQVIQPQVAYLMQSILSDDSARTPAFSLNGPLTIQGVAVAAKTGTTDGTRDLWTMGFTRNAVVGVWLGRPDDARTFVQGGGYNNVAPLWNEVMRAALGTMPRPEGFNAPTNGTVIQANICTDTGSLPPSTCRSVRPEFFLANQPPPGANQAFVQQVDIDSWTGLRANDRCPDNRVGGTFVSITDAAAVAWLNTPAGRPTAQRLGITTSTIDSVPATECDVNTDVPIILIISPTSGTSVSGVVQVTGAATANTFNRYQLEVATAANPTAFQIVDGPRTTPVTSGSLLGQWDTTRVPNGTYILRLAMFSSSGGFAYRTAQVNVNNIQPTAIPTTPPQPTLPPLDQFTPLPFIETTPIPFEESP